MGVLYQVRSAVANGIIFTMQPHLPLTAPWEQPLREDILALSDRAERLRRLLLVEDWNFHGQKDGSALHTLHPFPAKYPPQLPRTLIRYLTRPGEWVLDPMMGSGTTLLEARRLGRVALGSDIDPLALTLVAAKMQPPDVAGWRRAWPRILARAKEGLQHHSDRLRAALARRDEPTRAFLAYWFLPQTQLELQALVQAIEAEADLALRRLARIVFSSLIIAKSGSVAQARDLSHTRPHKVDKPYKSALEAFRQKARRVERLLQQVAPFPNTPWLLAAADAQRLPWPAARVALVVTSPPYAANAIDYMRAHKFTLVWWGFSIRDLGSLRGEYIGGEAVRGRVLEPLPPAAFQPVARIAAVDPKKAQVLHRYFSEMRRTLAQIARVLRPGGLAVLVVGDSTMRGLSTRTPEALAALGEQVGLRHLAIGTRVLDRDRRMMPARRGGAMSAIEQRMHREYLVGFARPEV